MTLTIEHGPDTGRAHDDAAVDTTELYRPGLEGTAFAFEFHSDAHVVSPKAIIGRHVAGAELLETVLESDGVDRAIILGDAEDERLFWKSTRKMRSEGIERIKRGDLQGIARNGCLLRSDPGLVDASWGRRLIGENAFSIVGMIHSLTTTRVQEQLQNLLTAPVQPWDAMICTSKAGRDSVEAIWESYRCYLERRGMTVPRPPLQLPVIPLGVHCRKFAATEEVLEQARKYRLELDIADQDVVALWLGRLSPLTKAHPTPMLLAMEQAQKRLKGTVRLHLLMAGQFPHPEVQKDMMAAAQTYSPSVSVDWVEGSNAEQVRLSRHVADLFLSMSDNVQETFGLTLVEAMAAGLPSIVSDWSGYRDIIIDGETGFRVPSRLPSSDHGWGKELADQHASGGIGYPLFVGAVAQSTAIHLTPCIESIVALASNKNLRRAMGQRAGALAKSRFDWKVVFGEYLSLFRELADRRRSEAGVGIRKCHQEPAYINCLDPLETFANFATSQIGADTVLAADLERKSALDLLLADRLSNFVVAFSLPPEEIHRVFDLIAAAPISVADLFRQFPEHRPSIILTSCMWLMKYGLVQEAP